MNENEHELEIEDFNELFQDVVVDPSSVLLTENDVDNIHVKVDLQKLGSYSLVHLKDWLLFRGDTLRGINSLKDAQLRVWKYFENGNANKIVDPTTEKVWLSKKAQEMGKILRPTWQEGSLPDMPDFLKTELANTLDLNGWSKSLTSIPQFTINNIDRYYDMVNNMFQAKPSKIKKHFHRGEQLIEEKFIDTSTMYAKQDAGIFYVKAVSVASLKNQARWVFVVIDKVSADVRHVFCQCPAGRAGMCSHAYAVMKLLAKWVLDKLAMIPEPKACTSRPCVWNVPQAREHLEKPPVTELTIKSPTAKKAKSMSNAEEMSNKKGIASTLYDSRANPENDFSNASLKGLFSNLASMHPKVHALSIINDSPQTYKSTQFGPMSSGSLLSYQCPLMPPDFVVYFDEQKFNCNNESSFFVNYPPFPFEQNLYVLDDYIKDIHVVENQKLLLLKKLQDQSQDSIKIEAETRDQADNPSWFSYRKERFTASLCNRICTPKTDRGFRTLASNIINGQKPSNVLNMKFEYGRFHEPIAIQHYERFMKIKGYNVIVESCGLVIDSVNYVLGATPDGKVNFNGSYGILEVKCSHQYKDVDPKLVCLISKNPCIEFDTNSGHITINKKHPYYNQIQMQLALTTQTWCDFIFFTSKGLVIDRVLFDKNYWEDLQAKIMDFYFRYMLPEIAQERSEKL